jgi:hypothetical protein
MFILSAETGVEHMEALVNMDLEDLYIRMRAGMGEAQVFTREKLIHQLKFIMRGSVDVDDEADKSFEKLWKENVIEHGAPGVWKFTELFDQRMDRVKSRWQVRYALQELITEIVDHEGAFGMTFHGSEVSWDAGECGGDQAHPKGGLIATKLTDEQVAAELRGIRTYLKDKWEAK